MNDLSGRQGGNRILLVDGDGPTRTLLRRLPAMEGYPVTEAADGSTALAQAATAAPDLALVDVIMPGQDGLDVFAGLRRAGNVPVILLSAKGRRRGPCSRVETRCRRLCGQAVFDR